MIRKPIAPTLAILFGLMTAGSAYSQEMEFKRSAIKTGIGFGINEGHRERGMGLVYSLGWQKSVGEKNKVRLNPNLTYGGFMPLLMSDTRDQFYRITSLGFNVHYDLVRAKSVSIVTTGGGFVNYSRGLLGLGGGPEENNRDSKYFYDFYFGGHASIGLRIDSPQRKLAYEIRPVNIHYGTEQFMLGYLMFGIDFKLME